MAKDDRVFKSKAFYFLLLGAAPLSVLVNRGVFTILPQDSALRGSLSQFVLISNVFIVSGLWWLLCYYVILYFIKAEPPK